MSRDAALVAELGWNSSIARTRSCRPRARSRSPVESQISPAVERQQRGALQVVRRRRRGARPASARALERDRSYAQYSSSVSISPSAELAIPASPSVQSRARRRSAAPTSSEVHGAVTVATRAGVRRASASASSHSPTPPKRVSRRPAPRAARRRTRGSSRASRSAPRFSAAARLLSTSDCSSVRGRRRRRARPLRACSRRGRRQSQRTAAALRRRAARTTTRSSRAASLARRRRRGRPRAGRAARASRSRICAGESTAVRAAASSTASGRSSSRRQSSSIIVGRAPATPARAAEELDAPPARRAAAPGYSTSPGTRSSSRLGDEHVAGSGTRSSERGELRAPRRPRARSCRASEQQLALADDARRARPSPPSVSRDRGRARAPGRATSARPTQNTPSVKLGTSSAAASIASRVLPEPPGPVSVTSRAPSLRASATTSRQLALAAEERASPAGAGSCSRSSSAAGSRSLAELEDPRRLGRGP